MVLVVVVENISIQEKNYKLIIMKRDVINVQNAKINFPQASFKIDVPFQYSMGHRLRLSGYN